MLRDWVSERQLEHIDQWSSESFLCAEIRDGAEAYDRKLLSRKAPPAGPGRRAFRYSRINLAKQGAVLHPKEVALLPCATDGDGAASSPARKSTCWPPVARFAAQDDAVDAQKRGKELALWPFHCEVAHVCLMRDRCPMDNAVIWTKKCIVVSV